MSALLFVWSALIFYVLGQIWFVQVVVYPLFARVGDPEYIDYHRFYARKIPWPVIVPGFASMLLPLPLALLGPTVPTWMTAVNVVAGLASMLVTLRLMIPRHGYLERMKDTRVIAELVRYNWPRTLAIVVQAAVTLAMLEHVDVMAGR